MKADQLEKEFNDFDINDSVFCQGDQWYGNLDNPWLVSLTNDKGVKDPEIIKFLFFEALLYLGLTIKRNEQDYTDNLEINDIEKLIKFVMRSNSSLVVPIIQQLNNIIKEEF